MIAKNVTVTQLETVAASVGVRLRDYTDVSTSRTVAVRFTLALNGEKYRRVNADHSRKVGAVCWHGHRDFFRALFAAVPSADVRISGRFGTNAHIRYTADNFETMYWETGDRNVGSMFYPCAYRDACECGE